MQVHRLINSPIDSNCFVVVGNDDNNCIVIDPGTENCEELLLFLDTHQLSVQYIFLTHEHVDHTIGCKTLKEHYPQAKIVCSDLCAQNLNNTRFNLSRLEVHYTPRDNFPIPEVTYSEKLILDWKSINVTFFKAKGHSPGSSHALIDKCLFVGDTYINHYKTTTTLPGGNKRELVQTFETLLNDYNDDVIIVYPGHFGLCTLSEMKNEIQTLLLNLKIKLEKKKL